jgi:Mg2+ and Co2+ transporter CorA
MSNTTNAEIELVDITPLFTHSRSVDFANEDVNQRLVVEDISELLASQGMDSTNTSKRSSTSSNEPINRHSRDKISFDLSVLPEAHTNVEDLISLIQTEGAHYSTIGLNYECRTFSTFQEMWTHITKILRNRQISGSTTNVEPVWIDIQNPTENDITFMKSKFGLHHLTSKDLLQDETSIEKVEQFGEYVRLMIKGLLLGGKLEDLVEINILIFAQYVITIRDAPVEGLEEVFHRLSRYELTVEEEENDHTQRRRSVLPSPDWVLHAFVDAIVGSFMPHVDGMMQEAENIDELVVDLKPKERYDLLTRIGLAKRSIGHTARSLMLKRDVLMRLRTCRTPPVINNAAQAHLHDVTDRLTANIDRLEAALEGVHNAHAHVLAKMQVDRKHARERIKSKANRIALLITTLSPFALVGQIWGMNTNGTPGAWFFGPEFQNLTWFFGIVAAMIVVTFGIGILIRPKILEFENPNAEILIVEPLHFEESQVKNTKDV